MTPTDLRASASSPVMEDADAIDRALDHPVVLLGRGGSGTRVLSQAAEALGIFLGNDINVSGDSVEWVRPIYDLSVETCEGGSTTPGWPDRLRAHASGILASSAWTPPRPWGWKLPETMLILPQVLEAFPAARVVHLVRHPVTTSLRRTHMTSRLDNPVGRAVLGAAYRDIGRPADKIETDESWQHNAISWLYQVQRVMRQGRDQIASGRYVEQRFEDFCAAPEDGFARLTTFLGDASGPPPDPAAGAGMAGRIDPVRASGEVGAATPGSDPRAAWVWSLCGPVAEALGYEPEPPA